MNVSINNGKVRIEGELPTDGWASFAEAVQKQIDAEQASPPSRGLGDTIAKITKAVGVKPCGGCAKRQAKLNKIMPYKP